MKSDFKVIIVDIQPLFVELLKKIDAGKVFPRTLAALNNLAYMYMETWRRFAGGAPMPGIPRVIHSRGGYIRSINVDTSQPYEKIVYTDYPHHKYIEEGHGEIDLKPGLLSGPKARKGRFGLYNIVPFRHGTPGTVTSNKPMPINIYNLIKKETDALNKAGMIGTSSIIGRTKKKPPDDKIYEWGYRIPAHMGGMIKKKITDYGTYIHKTGKYAGMVRMQASTSLGKSSKYLTFRIVSSKSDPASWIMPAVTGIPIRQLVVDTMRPTTEEVLRESIQGDLGQ